MTEAATRFEELLDAEHAEVRKQEQLRHGPTFRAMKSGYGGVPWDFMYFVMELNGTLDGATSLSYIAFLDTVVQERLRRIRIQTGEVQERSAGAKQEAREAQERSSGAKQEDREAQERSSGEELRRGSGEELRSQTGGSGGSGIQERIRRSSGSDQEERSASGPGALVGDSSAGEAHLKHEKRPRWRPWIGSWLRVPRRSLSRRAGIAARPFRPSWRPFSARWNWPCGQSRSGGAVTRYHQRGSPLTHHLRSRSFRPSTRPRIREVVNKLDALKSEDEGEGVNSCHCENKNALNESSTDAKPKIWVTLSRNATRTTTPRRRYRLMRPRWPRCLGGSCRIMRHGPWRGWQQLS